jgi:hypothetical protein
VKNYPVFNNYGLPESSQKEFDMLDGRNKYSTLSDGSITTYQNWILLPSPPEATGLNVGLVSRFAGVYVKTSPYEIRTF